MKRGLQEQGLRPAVFIDKDGTLVTDIPYNVDPARLCFTEGAVEALRDLQNAGYLLVVVSNQPGIALGRFELPALQRCLCALAEMLAREAVRLAGIHVCPHAPASGPVAHCLCRKPAAGLLYQAAREHGIDLRRSWMIGDILDDVQAGRRAGCRSVLVDVGNETVWRLEPERVPHHRAKGLREAADFILRNPQRKTQPAPSPGAIEAASLR